MVMQLRNKIKKLLTKSILVCLRILTGRYLIYFFSWKVEERKVIKLVFSRLYAKRAKEVVWRSQGLGGEFKEAIKHRCQVEEKKAQERKISQIFAPFPNSCNHNLTFSTKDKHASKFISLTMLKGTLSIFRKMRYSMASPVCVSLRL